MVEFGLKLEDNKVDEWSDKYIDYERLKTVLKKAGTAAKKRDEIMQRRPEMAKEVQESYEAEKATMAFPDPPNVPLSSVGSPVGPVTVGGGEGESLLSVQERQVPTGSVLEIKRKYGSVEKYGSQNSLGPGTLSRTSSEGSLTSLMAQAMSGVSSYFHKSAYTSKLLDSLKDVDKGLDAFGQALSDELLKVNTFYTEKSANLDERLKVLVENVYSLAAESDSEGQSVSERAAMIKEAQTASEVKTLSDVLRMGIKRVLDRRTTSNPLERLSEQTISLMDTEGSDDEDGHNISSRKKKSVKETDSVKRAMIDLHRSSKLLNNYSIMNYTGFVKIVKKFDKSFPDHKGEFKNIVSESLCHDGKEAENLADEMERLFANWFCGGNIVEARAKMLPKRGDGLQMDWSQLRLGYRLGMCSILALWVCWDCVWGLVKDGNSTIGGRTAFPVFRACGGLLLLHWCWGISVYIWSRYRINYIFLFDFNPRIVDTAINIFNDVVDETLVFLVLMLLYYKSGAHDIPEIMPAGCYPFILVLFTIWNLIFPLRTRAPLWQTIWHVVTAPITSPKFFHTYVADVFTSMVKVFQDMLWTTCFMASGDFLLPEGSPDLVRHSWQHTFWYKNVVIPLICLFPLWIRFNQCLRRYLDTGKRWPHLANAFKYAMSQTVTLFGAFHPLYLMHAKQDMLISVSGKGKDIVVQVARGHNLFQFFWMGLFITSSLYSFTWDIYMDWGLGRPKFGFLGPRLMFPQRLHYYCVMFVDLFLRFMWVLTLVPPQSGATFELPSYLSAVTMTLELIRRTLWGFFRLEHEHRHNTEGYRRVDFVPLHFNTGHNHKYKKQKEHVGWHVLAEVAAVSIAVIAISVTSVIAAQRATRYAEGLENSSGEL